MSAKIILTCTEGNLTGKSYEFEERTTTIIGRAKDCHPAIPDDENHRTISRYHCLLDINPPAIRVRDFGSLNGTYCNGKKIGQREKNQTPEEAAKISYPEYDLQNGDEIKFGETVLQVSIKTPNQIPPTRKLQNNPAPSPFSPIKNLLEYLNNLLQKANQGEPNLKAIRGYKLLKLLGKGGCGEVYLARHKQTGEEVALKLMLPEIVANPDAIQRFLREVQNTHTLNHPNVVKLLDFGHSGDVFFFTIEYCNSGSVLDLIESKQRLLTVSEAIPIILQVLDGLSYAHQAIIPCVKLADGSIGKGKGLVHRDIKPQNIFLDQTNNNLQAKIGDYGLAKAFDLAGLSGLSMSGTKAGTPAFMPRQQVLDFKYAQPEVDIWATAATLYFMLTGNIPRNLQGQDPFIAVLTTQPIPIRKRNASVPKPLAELIDYALIDEPEIGFKSAGEFKKALQGVGVHG
jgi:hypothetical protein